MPDGRRLAVALFARHGTNRPSVLASAARKIYDGFVNTIFALPFGARTPVVLH